jgi:Fe-S cluster biogenesis protein NfuA
MTEAASALLSVMDTVVDPLVRADGGELFVCELSPAKVVLHLRGRFSGCPGNTLAIRRVIEPALLVAAPRVTVSVTTGELVPDGAVSWQEHQQRRERR